MVHCGHEVADGDNFFAEECVHFTVEEKTSLRRYGKKANKKRPGRIWRLQVACCICPSMSK